MKTLKTGNQVEIGKEPILGNGPLLVQASSHDWIPNCSLMCQNCKSGAPEVVDTMGYN